MTAKQLRTEFYSRWMDLDLAGDVCRKCDIVPDAAVAAVALDTIDCFIAQLNEMRGVVTELEQKEQA